MQRDVAIKHSNAIEYESLMRMRFTLAALLLVIAGASGNANALSFRVRAPINFEAIASSASEDALKSAAKGAVNQTQRSVSRDLQRNTTETEERESNKQRQPNER